MQETLLLLSGDNSHWIYVNHHEVSDASKVGHHLNLCDKAEEAKILFGFHSEITLVLLVC